MSDTAADAIQGGDEQPVKDDFEIVYDAIDERDNGIAESDRESAGQWLKSHADDAGTSVRTGLHSLVGTTAVLRGGSQEEKRQMIGHLVDQYNIHERPGAEEPAAVDEFSDPVGQHSPATVTEYAASVGEIVGADPAAVGRIFGRQPDCAGSSDSGRHGRRRTRNGPPGSPAGRCNNARRRYPTGGCGRCTAFRAGTASPRERTRRASQGRERPGFRSRNRDGEPSERRPGLGYR